MIEGWYAVNYIGQAGSGHAVVNIESGRIVGADSGGGKYIGTYAFNHDTGEYQVKVHVSIGPGRAIVQGIVAPAEGLAFDLHCAMSANPDGEIIQGETEYGRVAFTPRLILSLAEAKELDR